MIKSTIKEVPSVDKPTYPRLMKYIGGTNRAFVVFESSPGVGIVVWSNGHARSRKLGEHSTSWNTDTLPNSWTEFTGTIELQLA